MVYPYLNPFTLIIRPWPPVHHRTRLGREHLARGGRIPAGCRTPHRTRVLLRAPSVSQCANACSAMPCTKKYMKYNSNEHYLINP
jgi:hypothetical protein